MRRLIIAAIVLLSQAGQAAQSPQITGAQVDGIARLLVDLERAISRGGEADFRAIATTAIPQAAVARFDLAAAGGPGAHAVIRERLRRPTGAGYDIVVDVLISREIQGRVATWLIAAVPDAAAAGQFKVADLRELAALDGLLKLRLDTSREFAVKDLVITAPDLVLTMSSGYAFAVLSPNGITGLVLRGKGEIGFSPPDRAEQLQLRIFSRRPDFRTDTDIVFVRMNSTEFTQRVAATDLVPTTVKPADVARAEQVFDEYSRENLQPQRAGADDRPLVDRTAPRQSGLRVSYQPARLADLHADRQRRTRMFRCSSRAGGHVICQYRSGGRGRRPRPGGRRARVRRGALQTPGRVRPGAVARQRPGIGQRPDYGRVGRDGDVQAGAVARGVLGVVARAGRTPGPQGHWPERSPDRPAVNAAARCAVLVRRGLLRTPLAAGDRTGSTGARGTGPGAAGAAVDRDARAAVPVQQSRGVVSPERRAGLRHGGTPGGRAG